MEALRSLVGRPDSLALLGPVVVQGHRVHAQNDHLWGLDLQPPEEQLLNQATKQPDPLGENP
jgi:hypothetical protein